MRQVNTVSPRELERRWQAVRGQMRDRQVDALVMQNSSDWVGGYCRWFCGEPATNGYSTALVFPSAGTLSLVEQGPFGGLIASGWHTGSMMMRMFADTFLSKGGLASPGVDEVRWVRPVRPNDRLRIRVTVLEARRSRSKPDRGLIRSFVEVLNQNNEPVMSLKPLTLHMCRTVVG